MKQKTSVINTVAVFAVRAYEESRLSAKYDGLKVDAKKRGDEDACTDYTRLYEKHADYLTIVEEMADLIGGKELMDCLHLVEDRGYTAGNEDADKITA